jgi:hypothetical protein
VALTSWEPVLPGDERLSERMRRVDLGAGLRGAGFVDVEVADRPQWLDCERAIWDEAVALDPEAGPALRSFHDEGVRSLKHLDLGLYRRAMASATAP